MMDGAVPQEVAQGQVRVVAGQAGIEPESTAIHEWIALLDALGLETETLLLVRPPIGVGDLENGAERLVGDRARCGLRSQSVTRGRRVREIVAQGRLLAEIARRRLRN